MPELPEVETVKRGLQRLLVGRTIKDVEIGWHKSFQATKADIDQFVVGAKINSIERRAKLLIVQLNSGYSLIIHLKMTGQLVYRGQERFGAGHPNDSLLGELPDKSTRVMFGFTDDTKLFFNDQRKFGWIKLIPNKEVNIQDFIKKLGPEPLENTFSSDLFISRLKRRNNSAIKAVLLDQTTLAGIGNIYADEALFLSKIHPRLRVKDIPKSKLITLYQSIIDVLRLSIDNGGSSDRNYIDVDGKRGKYLHFAKVFRKQGSPCLSCGQTIIKIRVAGRGTHICPREQKLPKGYK